ncbi:MAG: acyloxyacyl hydrolase [Nitrospira sp.]|nr:acyloxyacyl hydrolase [Nitrospira sp.]
MKILPLRRLFACGALTCLFALFPYQATAEDVSPHITAGTQTMSFAAGPFFPIRILSSQSSKLFGAAAMPSWSMTLTDPIGAGWYQGQLAIGAELLAFGTYEPITAYGVAVTPKLVYTFTTLNWLRPYVEGGGGPMLTDLGGRVPEQPGQFNFVVWGGAGCSWSLTSTWAVQAGYRFVHISNAGTRSPNSGLNFGMPFIGFSYSLY